MSSEDDGYRVGRGRPPLHTRFAPGKSGNPRGRPKGRKSPARIMDELLSRQVVIGEGRSRQKMTMEEVMMRRILQKAANGELKYVEFVLHLKEVQILEGGKGEALSPADEQIIAAYFEKRRGHE